MSNENEEMKNGNEGMLVAASFLIYTFRAKPVISHFFDLEVKAT